MATDYNSEYFSFIRHKLYIPLFDLSHKKRINLTSYSILHTIHAGDIVWYVHLLKWVTVNGLCCTSVIVFFIIEDRLLTPHADNHIIAKLETTSN